MVRRRSRSRKKKSGCLPGLLLLTLLVVGAAACALAWLLLGSYGPATETFVEIAPGSSTAQIATQLEGAGVLRSRYGLEMVRWARRGKKGSLKAGEYRFDHPSTPLEIYTRLVRGDVFTVSVTIPEGATIFDVGGQLEHAGLVRRAEFVEFALGQTALVADLDPSASSLEGYLFPDTYRFARKATAAQIATIMVKRFRTVLATQLGVKPSPATLRVHRLVTLASLVERETAVEADRPLVASVLSNRLKRNMPLMTDAAVVYGLERGGTWRGRIFASDLKRDTRYNTYLHTGLPPGPIANPGLKALRAALSPPETNYLYFVAAGKNAQGASRFSATLDEHNEAVAEYRRAVRQGGGH